MIWFVTLIRRLESHPFQAKQKLTIFHKFTTSAPTLPHQRCKTENHLNLLAHRFRCVGPPQGPPCRLPNLDVVFMVLKSAKNAYCLREAALVHGFLVVSGYLPNDVILGAQLVNMYVNGDGLREAIGVFHLLPTKSVFAWNSVLKGLLNRGLFEDTLEWYGAMLWEGLSPDNFTFPCVFKACSGLSDLQQGREIHHFVCSLRAQQRLDPNPFVECAIIDMYARCGSIGEARSVFENMMQRDLVCWGAMICGIVQSGRWTDALVLFVRMMSEGLNPDPVVLGTVIPGCGRNGAVELGKSVHGLVVKSGFENDLCVMNSLIDMYCKCGSTNDAKCLFESMGMKDVVSWSTLIAGHSQNHEHEECLSLYARMNESGITPNSVTIAGLLPTFSSLKMLRKGREIHNFVIRNGFEFDRFIGSALVDMYARCGSIKEAEMLFDVLPERDIAVWNSMITGYSLNEDAELTFKLLRYLQEVEVNPNSITLLSIIRLCTSLAMVKQGKEIHGYAMRGGFDSTVSVGNSLIDMYSKSGHLELGMKVFKLMKEKNAVTYNTVIGAFGMHGNGNHACLVFHEMLSTNMKPDKVTFVALLSACSHGGMLDQGWLIYNSMTNLYGVVPDMEHYACMVDLLGRSGHLSDAWEFVKKMPVDPDIDVLGSLLSACKLHKDVKLAEHVARKIFDLFPEETGYYVLLSNTYATVGRWDDVTRVRGKIKEKGLIKEPGRSWIQIRGTVHSFLAKDSSNPRFSLMSKALESLLLMMKDEGYIPDLSFSLLEPAYYDSKAANSDKFHHR
ncbi:Pentatricopeptide repeat-containing protein [Nymphaea thermarum]|nr:Pentatricopeptide repeat-containing protein [Nymphaea thermarum]